MNVTVKRLFVILACLTMGCKKEAFHNPPYDFTLSNDLIVGRDQSFTPNISEKLQYTYLWDFGDGHTATGYNPDHIYNTSGTYTITMTVNNDVAHAAQKTVTIAPAYYFYTAGTIIPGDTISYHFYYGVPAGNTYVIDFGDGSNITSTDTIFHHVYANTGYYNIKLKAGGDTTTYKGTLRIINDPLYTHLMAGSKHWHGKQDQTDFNVVSTTIVDTVLAITCIDPITISMVNNTFVYNPDSSTASMLVYCVAPGTYSYLVAGKIAYYYAKDSISFYDRYDVYPVYTGSGHPPPVVYEYYLGTP